MTTKRLNPLRLVTDVLVLVGSASSLKGKIHLRESKPSCFDRYKHIWCIMVPKSSITFIFARLEAVACAVEAEENLCSQAGDSGDSEQTGSFNGEGARIITIVHALKICAVHTWISLRLSINLVNIWNSPRIHPYHPCMATWASPDPQIQRSQLGHQVSIYWCYQLGPFGSAKCARVKHCYCWRNFRNKGKWKFFQICTAGMIQETQETVNIPESPRNCWMNK